MSGFLGEGSQRISFFLMGGACVISRFGVIGIELDVSLDGWMRSV